MNWKSRTASWVLIGACGAVVDCAPTPDDFQAQPIAIPGDWDPPASTRAIAAMQRVDVVDPPAVLPLGSCTSLDPWVGTCTHPACIGAHPGTTALDMYIRGRWTYVRNGGTYTCRRNSNPASTAYLSVHSIGRAIDLMIPQIGGDADNTAGDAVANWLIENAEYIGIQRVIWDGKYWNGQHGFSDISDARNAAGNYITDHHTNHIHTELSVDGAAQRTRFFTVGPPPTTCPVVCYGTAVVRADCTFTDCAATGQVCLEGPPRCGAGAPPPPLEAVHNAGAALPAVTPVAALSRFNYVAPQRLFDTRTDSARLTRSDGATTGPLTGTRSGTVTAWTGLPASPTSVWLNVTAVPIAVPGFINAFSAGPTPDTSTLNFHAPQVRANATAVVLGTGGGVTFAANTDVHVIGDLTGAFAPTGLGFLATTPTRVIDTRSGTPLVAGVPFPVDVHAPAGATGVVASVAVIAGDTPGFLKAFPCAAGAPVTSSVNYDAGAVATNTVISELSGGQLCIQSSQAVNAIVDVVGYLVPAGELSYQAIRPTRLLDTRSPTALYSGRLGERQIIELPIQALPGMPASVHAVVANIVAISPGTRGFLTAFPCGFPVPTSSSLNYDPDGPTAALNVTATGHGSLCIFASGRSDILVDVLGVWVPTPGAPAPTEPGMNPETPEMMDQPDGGTGPDAGTPVDDAGVMVGRDASVGLNDSGPRREAGVGPVTPPGCSCRVVGGRSGTTRRGLSAFAMLGFGLAVLRVRRRKPTC